MILIVDNYDSFVHNIARYFVELGEKVSVRRNDEVGEVEKDVKALVISPGPCTPIQAGASLRLVAEYSGRLPILGVCLGHQCIGAAFGGEVARATRPMHGEASEIIHNGRGLFEGIPNRFHGGRYHSLIVAWGADNPDLEITARSDEGEIMALQHRTLPTYGVQFHPESILTEHGYSLLRNFLQVVH